MLQVPGLPAAVPPPKPVVVPPTAGGSQGFSDFNQLPAVGPTSKTPVATPRAVPIHANSPAGASHVRARKKSGIPGWAFAVVAAVLAIPLCCGVAGYFVASTAVGLASAPPLDEILDEVPAPSDFPDLGSVEHTFPSGVRTYFIQLNGSSEDQTAGDRMKMRIYLPAGVHEPLSLPCVLVAPAGTPMIHGCDLDDGNYHDETLPYAEAGMAVIHYSIDGAIPDHVNQENEAEFSAAVAPAYFSFKQAGAGIVNGRNALEYAVRKIDAIDSRRIYSAGHSSAGALSLLLAAHDQRISRCVAYAAAYDLETRMEELTSDPGSKILLPGIKSFIQSTSPLNNTDSIQCPTFIFHAHDDSNVPYSDASRFVQKLEQTNQSVEFKSVARGDHYDSMIVQGIPAAIEWLLRE
jgi:acetyl esterase/lipase